ncbi:hypothetical protein, partial [uncultured Dubosiella sp.]
MATPLNSTSSPAVQRTLSKTGSFSFVLGSTALTIPKGILLSIIVISDSSVTFVIFKEKDLDSPFCVPLSEFSAVA